MVPTIQIRVQGMTHRYDSLDLAWNIGFPSSFSLLAVRDAFPVLQATESWKGNLHSRLALTMPDL